MREACVQLAATSCDLVPMCDERTGLILSWHQWSRIPLRVEKSGKSSM